MVVDWNAELEAAKQRVAELEEMVAHLREGLEQRADSPVPIARIVEQTRRTLSVRMANLERAKFHQRFIESQVAKGIVASQPIPYLELAEICFNVAKRMPPGEAAESVRSHGATFYTKAVALEKASPTEAQARAIFRDMATGWIKSE